MAGPLTDGPIPPEFVRRTSVRGVRLIPAGSDAPNPAELLGRPARLLERARQMADVVIVDTPPLLVANDATSLMPGVDTVVLVARNGRTRVGSATRTTEHLARLGRPVLGVVLVASDTSALRLRRYYYGRDERADPNGLRSRDVKHKAQTNGSGDTPHVALPGAEGGAPQPQ
jgi:Mrp family chromosome partitioning ATPase